MTTTNKQWAVVRDSIEMRLETATNPQHIDALSGVLENTTNGVTEQEPTVSGGSIVRDGRPHGKILSQVQKEPTLWLWPGHITSGITICYGLPGCGKSLFSSYYIAGLTQGWPNPDGTLREQGSAVTVAFEDNLESTTVERFEMAGANMDKISDITMVEKDDTTYGGTLEKPFSLFSDQDELFYELTAMRASIVCMDPLSMLFDGISNYNNQKIGKCLWNLKVRAEKEGVCILLIGHPNKDGVTLAGGAQLERIARMIFHFSKDPTRKDVCVMKNVKNNLTALQPPMAFSTKDGKLEWIYGESPSDTAKHKAKRVEALRQSMQDIMDSNPDTMFGARDFANLDNYDYTKVRGKLQDMFHAGVVTNPAYGKYQSILHAKQGVQTVQMVQGVNNDTSIPAGGSVSNNIRNTPGDDGCGDIQGHNTQNTAQGVNDANRDAGIPVSARGNNLDSSDSASSIHRHVDGSGHMENVAQKAVAGDKTLVLNGHKPIEQQKTEKIA